MEEDETGSWRGCSQVLLGVAEDGECLEEEERIALHAGTTDLGKPPREGDEQPFADRPPDPVAATLIETCSNDDLSELLVPYDLSVEDDDDFYSDTIEARFLDTGWDGECLQDTEDIDFEFVYALHTFVATVEGQANATKGDTMVLLDDSNSYWWLVRVVKDSSIGAFRAWLSADHELTPPKVTSRQSTSKRQPSAWRD